jgi:hypothetical protein
MKLNKKSWHCKLYKWAFCMTDKHLPKNLCDYFWSVILAVLTLPLTIITVFCSCTEDYIHRVGLSVLLYLYVIMLWFIGFMVLRITCDPTFYSNHTLFQDYILNWMTYLALPVGATIVWLGLNAVMFVFMWSDKHGSKKKIKVNKESNILVEYIKAKKEKACPFIDWE